MVGLLHAARQPVELRQRPADSTAARTPAGLPTDLLGGADAQQAQPIYAWTDLTYLLHKHQVSWGYYVVSGTEPDCENHGGR